MGGDVADPEARPPRSLTDRLSHLFRTVRPAPHREYSNEEVATAITRDQGMPISASYVWYLRTGQRDNPTYRHVQALATFFGVPAAYFFEDDTSQRVDAELDLRRAMADAGVRTIALRAEGLSPESIGAIADVIERVRHLEGLSRSANRSTEV